MSEKEPKFDTETVMFYFSYAFSFLIIVAIASNTGYRVYDNLKDKSATEVLLTLITPEE